jgi:uncharacterized delta-60 repeat protein
VLTNIGEFIAGFPKSFANAIAIQTDGKIVVVGSGTSSGFGGADFVLVRYNPDGLLDTTFGFSGIVTTNIRTFGDFANAVALQADGNILVAGQSCLPITDIFAGDCDFALARYLP